MNSPVWIRCTNREETGRRDIDNLKPAALLMSVVGGRRGDEEVVVI